MHQSLIFLKPYFEEKIWGGNKLKKFGFDLFSERIGEAWLISAIKDKSSIIVNPEFNQMNLYDFFNKYRDEFFGSYANEYPLLTKIIDANDDLSVQVHPNDDYAKKHHNKLGKTECWYILDCLENASIIYGHKAQSIDEIKSTIDNDEWIKILNKIFIKPHDFFYVPSGTIHAINKGNLIFELQQSSDITYRLFDYHRVDNNGLERELHIKDSLNVIQIPFINPINQEIKKREDFLVDNNVFKLKKVEVNNLLNIASQKYWMQATVIDGNCYVNNMECKTGISFISKAKVPLKISGNATLLLSWIE